MDISLKKTEVLPFVRGLNKCKYCFDPKPSSKSLGNFKIFKHKDVFKYLGIYVSMDIVKAINVGLKAAEKSVRWFKHRVRMGGGLGDTLINYYLN